MAARPFIVLGDGTSHGGTVIEASCMTDTHGKGIARVGDQVTCPIPGHGTTVIVSGDPTMIIDGKPAARHGDKCACGAVLIARQMVSTVGGSGTSNPKSANQTQKDHVAAPAPRIHLDEEATPFVMDSQSASFDQHFLLIDELTGVPLIEQPYTIHVGGRAIAGVTDADGHTQRIATGQASEQIEIEIHGEVCHG